MADFAFKIQRGSKEYAKLDWNGDEILGIAAEAARRGIDDITEKAADMARTNHPNWTSRTGQTEDAIFSHVAIFEAIGTGKSSTPHVWGEWGIEDRPRLRGREFDEDDIHDAIGEATSTVEVAMFLEFGTAKMQPKTPWLYATWDTTKLMLLPAIAEHYQELSAMNWRPGMGEGAFKPMSSLWTG